MPILGVVASSISGSKAITGNYYSIQTATVDSGGASSITFSSIPSTYTHLQIRGIYNQTQGTTREVYIRFNSDTGNNYATHYLFGNGSSAAAGANTSVNYIYVGQSGGTANYFGGTIIDILDYANTNKYKTVRSLWGWDQNGSGQIFFSSGLWQNTNAITSITLPLSSGNMSQYSQFALYGVK